MQYSIDAKQDRSDHILLVIKVSMRPPCAKLLLLLCLLEAS